MGGPADGRCASASNPRPFTTRASGRGVVFLLERRLCGDGLCAPRGVLAPAFVPGRKAWSAWHTLVLHQRRFQRCWPCLALLIAGWRLSTGLLPHKGPACADRRSLTAPASAGTTALHAFHLSAEKTSDRRRRPTNDELRRPATDHGPPTADQLEVEARPTTDDGHRAATDDGAPTTSDPGRVMTADDRPPTLPRSRGQHRSHGLLDQSRRHGLSWAAPIPRAAPRPLVAPIPSTAPIPRAAPTTWVAPISRAAPAQWAA